MANLVSKIMLKMKLVSSDKVVFVNNALELLGSYVGQTPAKVDAKVMEAKGGIMFIDEGELEGQREIGRNRDSGDAVANELRRLPEHHMPASQQLLSHLYIDKPQHSNSNHSS